MNSGYPGYPPQPGSGSQYPQYPSQGPGMPSPYQSPMGFNAGYPPQPTGNLPQSAGYPPQPSGYPPQPSSYPPQSQTVGYPPQSQAGRYLPQPGQYPSQAGTFAPQFGYQAPTGYPAAQPIHPSTTPSYPGSAPGLCTPQMPLSNYSAPSPNLYNNAALTTVGPGIPPHSNNYPTPGTIPAMHQSVNVMAQDVYAPTVRPISPFDPRNDAETLRRAMKGFGTDEKAIITVLTRRSNQQRQEIALQFKALYGKDLVSDLKSELSGKFEDLIVALMTPSSEFLANEIYHAIEGLGTKESTIIEIICTASNAEIFALKNSYQRIYKRSVEQDLKCDTSGHFRRLMVSMLQGRRSENNMVDEAGAIRDAQSLLAAGVLMLGTDESTFNAILVTRSYSQLKRIFMEYQRFSGHTLEAAIRGEFSGDIKDGLLAIVHSVENKAGFFAERIRDAVACIGTSDRQLIRIIVSRCEIDMQHIKQAYQQNYGKSLEQDISDDTSGDYKKALLALVSGY